MIDPSRVQFPKVNKTFLQGIFWIGVFLFLATIFSSARGIYAIFLKQPEVRKEIIQLGDDVRDGQKIWLQRAIIVHNRGNDDANNVKIKCLLPNGKISRLEVISDEDYSISDIEHGSADCAYSLVRLSAGSKIVILMWAAVPLANDQKTVMPFVSASYDGGVAVSSEKPTALEEVGGIGNTLKQGVNVIAQQFRAKISADEKLQQLTTKILPSIGIYFGNTPIVNGSDFKSALIAVFMLIVIAWLLLPRAWAGLFAASSLSLLVWLFVNVEAVAIIWLTVPFVLGIFAFWATRSRKEVILLGVKKK